MSRCLHPLDLGALPHLQPYTVYGPTPLQMHTLTRLHHKPGPLEGSLKVEWPQPMNQTKRHLLSAGLTATSA